MKKNDLFPHRFKLIGWCLFVPFFGLLLLMMATDLIDDSLITFPTLGISLGGFFDGKAGVHIVREGMLQEIVFVGLSLGLLFISFSKERDEDELIGSLRMQSFVWAVKWNTALLIVGTWIIFGSLYLYFMYLWIFSLFFFYIGRFEWQLYQLRKEGDHEE